MSSDVSNELRKLDQIARASFTSLRHATIIAQAETRTHGGIKTAAFQTDPY